MTPPQLAALNRAWHTKFFEAALVAIRKVFTRQTDMEQQYFHPGVLEYQKQTLLKLMEMGGVTLLRGKKILEIGGNGDMAVGKTLYNWSGKKITVVTPDPELHQNVLDDQKFELVLRGAEDTQLPDSSFDLIYGCAILEHVLEFERMFRECFRLLKPGGHLLLQGGPHWHSRIGHHLFIVNAEMDYRFSGNNPVPDFGHLYLSKDEMDIKLADQGIPQSHREVIIRQIYDDTSLNRAYLENILKAFQSLSWDNIEIDTEGVAQPAADILSRIQANQDTSENRVFAENLYIVARKHAQPNDHRARFNESKVA